MLLVPVGSVSHRGRDELLNAVEKHERRRSSAGGCRGADLVVPSFPCTLASGGPTRANPDKIVFHLTSWPVSSSNTSYLLSQDIRRAKNISIISQG